MEDIWGLKKRRLEELVEERGFTNLRWCPADPTGGANKNVGWILYGRPQDYKGPYVDYLDPVVVQIVDDSKSHLGYRWSRMHKPA